jgi:hypothetical protein
VAAADVGEWEEVEHEVGDGQLAGAQLRESVRFVDLGL